MNVNERLMSAWRWCRERLLRIFGRRRLFWVTTRYKYEGVVVASTRRQAIERFEAEAGMTADDYVDDITDGEMTGYIQ